jgi:hypothetical protein
VYSRFACGGGTTAFCLLQAKCQHYSGKNKQYVKFKFYFDFLNSIQY